MACIADVVRTVLIVVVRVLSSLYGALATWLLGMCSAAPPQNSTNDGESSQRQNRRPQKVAVIGGGIAGTAAAWSLARSREVDSVTLFEPRPVLGGNAKTFLWHVADKDKTGAEAHPSTQFRQHQASSSKSTPVRTGLSVLAWPKVYFKNYELLLRELGVKTCTVTPKFYVARSDGRTATFRQGEENPQWRAQQVRWDRAVASIRRINWFCFTVSRLSQAAFQVVVSIMMNLLVGGSRGAAAAGKQSPTPRTSTDLPSVASLFSSATSSTRSSVAPSLYEMTTWNPMNVIPARWFCRVFYGIDDAFWHDVVVPVYSSSFLTTRLDALPCVILPALDDIISVGDANRLKPLETWAGSSKDVFDKMACDIGEENVLTSVAIDTVTRRAGGSWEVIYRVASSDPALRVLLAEKIGRRSGAVDVTATEDDVGGRHSQAFVTGNVWREVFDVVVFACPATAVKEMTTTNHRDGVNRDVCPGDAAPFVDDFFEAVIGNVRYENERDDNFVTGTIHAERSLVCPSAPMREELFERHFTNYIQLHDDDDVAGGQNSLENTFILGTWVPSAVAAAAAAEASAAAVSLNQPSRDETENHANVGGGAHDLSTRDDANQSSALTTGDRSVDSTPRKAKRRPSYQRRRTKKTASTRDHQVTQQDVDEETNGGGEDVSRAVQPELPGSVGTVPNVVLSNLRDEKKDSGARAANTCVEDGTANMFVTYNAIGDKKRQLSAVSLGEVDNRWAHPQFTFASLALSLLIPFLQGTHGAFYCASYTTPGNGHDLSLLSGLAVAHEITGGYYPFNRTAEASAKDDFVLLKRLLFGNRGEVVFKDAAATTTTESASPKHTFEREE